MIYTPKIFASCKGATNAVNIAYKILENEKQKKKPRKIYILKKLLHSEEILEDLHNKGIDCVENIDNITKKSIIIIRSHGEGKKLYEDLKNKNIDYYDATCINVKKIHDIVNEKSLNGYKIIIIGNKSHPEVRGTLGWTNNNGYVIESKKEIDTLNFNDEKLFVVSQTTFNYDLFNCISATLKNKYKNVTVFNTICKAQKAIQASSLLLASKMDIMLVIGDKNSFNTNELYKACATKCRSFKFSNINDFLSFVIKDNEINNTINIGITGGASTPTFKLNEYKNLLEFLMFYKHLKPLFEKSIIKLNFSFKNSKDNEIIKDVINKFININKDGKYIRATLIALGYKMGSITFDDNFMNLALAYETFQTSVLIHDDIIDNAVLRRGKETLPYTFEKEFNSLNENKNSKELKHFTNSIGICAGDLGFYLANKIIINNYKENKNFSKILSYYNDIVIKTIKGEIIDIVLPFKEKHIIAKSTEKDVMEIYHLKTSWYTIIGPFMLGLILSGNYKYKSEMEDILNNIGIAFQIKDDIIGIFNSTEKIGKSNQSDVNEYKQTLLYSYTINQKKYKKELLKYYGKNNLEEAELTILKSIFINSGALNYAQNKMNELFENSENKIKNATYIKEDIKNLLLGLIIYLKIRTK